MRNLFLASVVSVAVAPLSSRPGPSLRTYALAPLVATINSRAGACGMCGDGLDGSGDYTDG